MPLIKNKQFFPCHRPLPKQVLLMCGFGGSIWQTRRLIHVLNRASYDVTALDFSKTVLSSGDVSQLPQLVNEVTEFAESLAKTTPEPTLLVGISLGSLLALNILRRSNMFTEGVLITGGDIAKIAQKLYPAKWPQSYAKLAEQWQDVNMYTNPDRLKDKHLLFVVHAGSKLIDPHDIYKEVERQQTAGNHLELIERNRFDHIGTITIETMVLPQRALGYIAHVRR